MAGGIGPPPMVRRRVIQRGRRTALSGSSPDVGKVGSIKAIRCSEAADDFGPQELEVPGEYGIGTGLYGASRDERVVDGAADDSVGGASRIVAR